MAKHDGGQLVELYLFGSLLVITGGEVWDLIYHEPEIRKRAERWARATEARETKAPGKQLVK